MTRSSGQQSPEIKQRYHLIFAQCLLGYIGSVGSVDAKINYKLNIYAHSDGAISNFQIYLFLLIRVNNIICF